MTSILQYRCRKTKQLTEKTWARGCVVLAVSTKQPAEHFTRFTAKTYQEEQQECNSTDDICYLQNICRTEQNRKLKISLTSMEVNMFQLVSKLGIILNELLTIIEFGFRMTVNNRLLASMGVLFDRGSPGSFCEQFQRTRLLLSVQGIERQSFMFYLFSFSSEVWELSCRNLHLPKGVLESDFQFFNQNPETIRLPPDKKMPRSLNCFASQLPSLRKSRSVGWAKKCHN